MFSRSRWESVGCVHGRVSGSGDHRFYLANYCRFVMLDLPRFTEMLNKNIGAQVGGGR